MDRFLIVLIVCILAVCTNINSQNIELVFQDIDDQSACDNFTNCEVDSLCYNIEYKPLVTGIITSYTFGLIGSCLDEGAPYLSGGSCAMSDNSLLTDACSSNNAFLLQVSGNGGSTPIDSGEVVVLHTFCFDIGINESILLQEDEVTGLTVSIDSINSQLPITAFPIFEDTVLTHSSCNCYIESISPIENISQTLPCQSPIDTIKFMIGGTSDIVILGLPQGIEFAFNNQILQIYGVPDEFGIFNPNINLLSECINIDYSFSLSLQACVMKNNQCFNDVQTALESAIPNDSIIVNCDLLTLPIGVLNLPENIIFFLKSNVNWQIKE